ncbi:MAG: NAD(P)/FAD-dependent oxidoreductase [Candidatus Stygibacter australis]|nr:NAD(P)/FAD-dependent oxidoreductase [Candidatus Stygibacter australis]MDP8321424.1 NAD(P)/FAD-dependent oxidoreductase [Candidatus Stygibacter australis]
MYDVIVIGGGASGCLAAGTSAEQGKKVLLIEKNDQIGRKLQITGKGRCNLTNASDVQSLIRNCPKNGKFLTNAFYQFTSEDTIQFFEKLGVKCKIERGNRVFPESDKASDIVSALNKFLTLNRVEVIKDKVTNIARIHNEFQILTHNENIYKAKALVIASGGKSYPQTGSTGDGYRFAEKLGHTTNLLKPALVPIETAESWVTEMQGLSLKNVEIKIINNNHKTIYKEFGEMLFTHYGVSGPIILSASSHIKNFESIKLIIDLKPALDEKALDKRLLREIELNHNKQYQNMLKSLLPQKMISVIVKLSEIEPDRPAHSINKIERKRLIKLLKEMTITLTKFRPLAEAIVTSGGICVNEIDPHTMQSRLVEGLYFAGEIIDVDAYTGGFNLQIAFSTGFMAGKNA